MSLSKWFKVKMLCTNISLPFSGTIDVSGSFRLGRRHHSTHANIRLHDDDFRYEYRKYVNKTTTNTEKNNPADTDSQRSRMACLRPPARRALGKKAFLQVCHSLNESPQTNYDCCTKIYISNFHTFFSFSFLSTK